MLLLEFNSVNVVVCKVTVYIYSCETLNFISSNNFNRSSTVSEEDVLKKDHKLEHLKDCDEVFN